MNESLNVLSLIAQASVLVQIVMALLVALSFVSWVLIFRFAGKLGSTARFDERFVAWFDANPSLDDKYQSVQAEREKSGLEAIFDTGVRTFTTARQTHNAEQAAAITERSLRSQLGKEQGEMERGLSWLASIGSVSPYIGLFGTVWGIMNAFIGLSDVGSASLATVAPGIAEALIATAIGLFAAIPASLAFNHFTAKAQALHELRALFCDDLLAALLLKDKP
ncbi:protein TolQ [Moraxella caviae]|uniref:Protein TolQ n=1 Tax=Moraxella caviae TaxID=34060 RepID=A0A1T0A304_9GAMM|nr:protein TolQ [Moraxella caviae]OOR90087.1 protein TolQ [Moraxella caviae]STZ14704.1 colicin uptake protein TolQ [Moraxella caviae]VEW11421.1 colicin uptake protein TolQ [Moraxella caviae]VEW12868.1 colicin uptake protein TolQ [Moraxella caviae]